VIDEIKSFLYFLFANKILESIKKERRKDIHVTHIVYNCLRRGYYAIKYNIATELLDSDIEVGLSEKTLMKFWIGEKLHELEITDYHHFDLSDEDLGIKGEMDEGIEYKNHFILIDKKTCKKIPPRPYVHHKKQINYYAALLYIKTGIRAKYGAVVYINVAGDRLVPYPFLIANIDKTLVEMQSKIEILKEALKTGVPPPPVKSWLCQFCMFYEQCVKDGVKYGN